jgi:hypothetical protein
MRDLLEAGHSGYIMAVTPRLSKFIQAFRQSQDINFHYLTRRMKKTCKQMPSDPSAAESFLEVDFEIFPSPLVIHDWITAAGT